MPYYQGAAAFISKINMYQHVRLAELERADTIERQGKGGGVVTSPTWPMESTIDMDTDEEPSDVPQRDNTAGYNWRADLTDNTYRFDKLVQHSGPDGDKQVTTTGKLQPIQTLTHWINEIHGRGGDIVPGRRLADSPISHHNTWERVASHSTYDTPSGVYHGGGACVFETPTAKSNGRHSAAGPTGDPQSGVFDSGGDHILVTPPAASDNRPTPRTKAYIIRVDKIKLLNDGLRDTRDKLKLENEDMLKLCAAATQSDDSVATE